MSDKTYEMIGGDGEQYGPFTIQQLQDNLSNGRANAQTQIREPGTEAWQPLGQLLGSQSIENFADYREAILAGNRRLDVRLACPRSSRARCSVRGWSTPLRNHPTRIRYGFPRSSARRRQSEAATTFSCTNHGTSSPPSAAAQAAVYPGGLTRALARGRARWERHDACPTTAAARCGRLQLHAATRERKRRASTRASDARRRISPGRRIGPALRVSVPIQH